MTRALVTGGAGFIGSHLVDRLLERGYEVRVLDSFVTGRRSNLAQQDGCIELIEGDIRDPETTALAATGCDVVFHQAALGSVPRSIADPTATTTTNVLGTLNVLVAARNAGVRRVVAASSSSIYGANPHLPKHEDLEPLPISPYATSKLAGEGFCRSDWLVHGLETVALRYFNVYGPRQDPNSQYAAVIPAFVSMLMRGQPPRINGDGLQSRDFTFVADVVDANLAALDSAVAVGNKYNVAGGRQVTIVELYEEIRTLLGVDIAPTHGPSRSGDVRAMAASLERARADLGWTPMVPLRTGLTQTVAHLAGELAPDIAR